MRTCSDYPLLSFRTYLRAVGLRLNTITAYASAVRAMLRALAAEPEGLDVSTWTRERLADAVGRVPPGYGRFLVSAWSAYKTFCEREGWEIPDLGEPSVTGVAFSVPPEVAMAVSGIAESCLNKAKVPPRFFEDVSIEQVSVQADGSVVVRDVPIGIGSRTARWIWPTETVSAWVTLVKWASGDLSNDDAKALPLLPASPGALEPMPKRAIGLILTRGRLLRAPGR